MSSNSERGNHLINYLRNLFTTDENPEEAPSREVIVRMLNRVQNIRRSSNEESDESDSERRRYYYNDELAESNDELLNPKPDEEYIDFRTYPIYINWGDIENEKSNAYKIYDKYGLFGVGIFQCLDEKEMKITSKRFEFNFIDFYFSIMNDNSKLENLITRLPKLSKVREVIYRKIFTQKELIIIKLYLDINENYYRYHNTPFNNV
jgi:hypothetical protein